MGRYRPLRSGLIDDRKRPIFLVAARSGDWHVEWLDDDGGRGGDLLRPNAHERAIRILSRSMSGLR